MRVVMAAVGAVFVGLLAVSVLGVASAETTSSTPASTQVRTVSVEGVASEPVAADATAAAATTVYREAMAAAIADGKEKAQFLAEKSTASIGQVESITEGGGYITCPGEEEYAGGEPDFGSGTTYGVVSPEVASAKSSPGVATAKVTKVKKHRKHASKRKNAARVASVEPCSLATQVSLSYEL